GTCQRHRNRSLPARSHGRASAPVLLADRALLVDLDLRRFPRHVGGVARDPRHWGIIRDSTISHFQLYQSMDCRYWRIARFHGMPLAVPGGLASGGAVAVSSVAQSR